MSRAKERVTKSTAMLSPLARFQPAFGCFARSTLAHASYAQDTHRLHGLMPNPAAAADKRENRCQAPHAAGRSQFTVPLRNTPKSATGENRLARLSSRPGFSPEKRMSMPPEICHLATFIRKRPALPLPLKPS